MYPHRIRLRGPWEATYAEPSGKSITQRITLPGGWSQLDTRATDIVLTRQFGRPRVLDADERVWLVWSGVAGPIDATLNEHRINDVDGGSEITGLLEPRNTLTVRCHRRGAEAASLGEFALEIRGPVFLKNLRLQSRAGLRFVTGEVSGAPRKNLEIYVLVHGRTVHHELVHAATRRSPFELPCPDPDEGPANPGFPLVRVELVEGATCWWRADFSRESDGSDWPAFAAMPE